MKTCSLDFQLKTYPKISIVTPSFNQSFFLERTIQSVLDQNYPNLEYVIIDGGSTDGSQDIIKKYADKLTYWVSEPDEGQYDAINKGFLHTSGDIMAWINSDDMYFPNSLFIIAEIFYTFRQIQWLTSTSQAFWDIFDRPVCALSCEGFNKRSFLFGRNGAGFFEGATTCFIMQESTFWTKPLWNKIGAKIDSKYSLAADFDLWSRFWKYEDLYCTDALISGFRYQNNQRSSIFRKEYIEEAKASLTSVGGKIHSPVKRKIFKILKALTRYLRIPNFLLFPFFFITYDHTSRKWKMELRNFVY